MTYSLIEKEATIYEQQIDELFNLTEKEAEVSYTDKDGRTWTGDNNYINTIKFADDNDHYMTMYKGLPPPQQGTTGIQPHVTGDDTDGQGGGTDPPILIPPVKFPKKVAKPRVIPHTPKPVKPRVIPHTPKPRVIPHTTKPRVIPHTTKPVKPRVIPHTTKPTAIPHTAPQKVISTKPLSPRNQIAAKIAQKEADSIIKRLQNNKTTLPQGRKLLVQLKKLEQLKPLRLNIPKAQIPPRFGLPAPDGPKVTVPKLDVPDSKALTTEIEVTRNKLAAAQKAGNTKLTARLTTHLEKQLGTYVDPKAGAQKTAANARASAIRKAEAEALALRQEKQAAEKVTAQAAEKARLAKIAKDAEEAALAKQTAQQQKVSKSPEKQNIERDIDTKQKAKVEADRLKAKVKADTLKATAVKEPTPQSKMAKGMVQPKKGQGIKSFAKQLGYNTVEEFEKANPKGVGIDKKTGNKFVKTGVSYIDQQAFGVANELDNAKRLLNKAQNAKKLNPERIAKLEKQVGALSGKTPKPTVVGKPGNIAPGIKDLRKMSFGKGLSYGKVYAALAKRAAGKGLAKAGGYLVPGLNIALLAWDAHELVVGRAGEKSYFGSYTKEGKQKDLNNINAILDSEATIDEKRKAIEAFGEGKHVGYWEPGWHGRDQEKRWDKDGDEHDPPLPFELKNINGRKMDINTVPIEKYEEVIANHVTENMAPYTQKDLNVLINRIETMKEHAISGGRRKATQRQIDAYDAKIKKLAEIRKTYPKSRKNAFKNLFTMMVDVHEQEQAKGEVYDFTNKKTETGSALENAFVNATDADIADLEKHKERHRKQNDAGFMSFSNWGQSSVGRFVDNTIDGIAGDAKPSYAYIEPGSKYDTNNIDNTATAGMSVTPTPSQNNDPSVVTTVGTPYGNNPGAPANFREYETLMQDVSTSFDLPIAVVRALAMQESGMHVTNKGKLGPWSYTGDHTLGKKGAFGPFHVRSDPDKGASLEHYNEVKGTTYTWKDIASNGMLAAKVGATYFKHWYDKTGGDAQKAYELYNGGPSGYMKTQSIANAKKFKERLDKFNESRNFANKSAILEGMALAT